MRALVLGGSVFVGKRLVGALLAQDADVAVLNRGKTPTALPDGVEHLVADRTDTASMRSALGDRAWDAVFDVSGFVMAAGDSNIAELLDLFDGRVRDYVYVSSIMAYDQSLAGVFPWTEDLPSNPDGPGTYGGFKAVAEQAMLDRHTATGFPASVVRPAAIYGPDNNIFDMETPMFLRLLQRRPILLPHGGLVATSYGHVDDLCELMVAMVGRPAVRGEVFNVTAEGLTSARYVQELAAIVGADPDIVYVPDDVLASLTRPVFGHLFGVRHHAIASIEKATSLLGFRPRYDFVDGHVETYAWFREQGWGDLSSALSDPVWGASWDFDAEAEVAGPSGERAERANGPSGRERKTMSESGGVGEIGRPSDAAMWTSMVATLREVVLPGLDDPHRRQVAIHLMGVAAYARDRGADPNSARAAELAAALDGLVRDGNELARRHWREGAPPDPRDVLAATSAVLVAAVDAGAGDGSGDDAGRAQAALRPILARHLADDLATEEVMLRAFRGVAPEDEVDRDGDADG